MLIAAYGAELVLTDGALGMAGAIAKAEELKKEIPGSMIAGQFTNPANWLAHYRTTGPEDVYKRQEWRNLPSWEKFWCPIPCAGGEYVLR